MTPEDAITALGDHDSIVVASRSATRYRIEADVLRANAGEADPFIYGWPEKPHPRGPSGPRWFFLRNVTPVVRE